MNIEEELMNSNLSDNENKNFLKILKGERLPELYSDVVSKHVFSPDLYPERLNYLLSHIMKDSTIMVDKSASNEGYVPAYKKPQNFINHMLVFIRSIT